MTQDQDSKLNEITSIWRIDEVFPAFYVSLESSSIQDGDVSISDEVEFSWSLGTNNQNVSFELLNNKNANLYEGSIFEWVTKKRKLIKSLKKNIDNKS